VTFDTRPTDAIGGTRKENRATSAGLIKRLSGSRFSRVDKYRQTGEVTVNLGAVGWLRRKRPRILYSGRFAPGQGRTPLTKIWKIQGKESQIRPRLRSLAASAEL